MYIKRLHARRLKLLRDFELDFIDDEGKPRMWTVIIGPNGTAKTTILRAIALAAAGPLQVNGLARPVVDHLVDRRSDEAMELEVTFSFSARASAEWLHPQLDRALRPSERLLSRLEQNSKEKTLFGQSRYIDADGHALELHGGRDPLDEARSKQLPLWFVAGYGISRVLPRPHQQPVLSQVPVERLTPLFEDKQLVSLSFLDMFPDDKARRYAKALAETLTKVEELVPKLVGLELGGRGGVTASTKLTERDRIVLEAGKGQLKMPAVALSHGYQSTLAWIADLIGHVMWEADTAIDAADIEGLVLIDEIDLYLHPSWQASLIPALRQTFPRLQFVVTTHSPVVLSSLDTSEIIAVDQNPETGDVERFVHDEETGAFVPLSAATERARLPDPRTMSGADLYRTWFGINRLTPYPHGELLREYSMLATDPRRTDDEDDELTKLVAELDALEVRRVQPVERESP